MRKIFVFALTLAIALGGFASCEAGLFRKRNGERRAPVRNVLKGAGGLFGGCHGGSCGR